MKNEAGQSAREGRFVLLRHEMPALPATETVRVDSNASNCAVSHWDLMFEQPQLLLTFRLMQLPEIQRSLTDSVTSGPLARERQHVAEGGDAPWGACLAELSMERLPDHRQLYLEYEGAVSGGRGYVRAWAAGHFRVVSPVASPCQRVRLLAPSLSAAVEFNACAVGETTQLRVHAWQLTASD